MHYVKSEFNIADLGTKPLARNKFEKFRNLIMGHKPKLDISRNVKNEKLLESDSRLEEYVNRTIKCKICGIILKGAKELQTHIHHEHRTTRENNRAIHKKRKAHHDVPAHRPTKQRYHLRSLSKNKHLGVSSENSKGVEESGRGKKRKRKE